MARQKFLTKAIEKKIPALYAQDGKGDDAIVHVKFFTPWAGWTWYATEYDPETDTFFGWVDGNNGEAELGYFSGAELKALKGPFGLYVERDIHFTPKTLAEVKA
jgi:hypothetical protein